MATLLTTTDRDAGIKAVKDASLEFLKKTGKRIDFPLTKGEMSIAIGDVWDHLGDFDYRSVITGNPQTALPEEYIALLVYATARFQFLQYKTTLPDPGQGL